MGSRGGEAVGSCTRPGEGQESDSTCRVFCLSEPAGSYEQHGAGCYRSDLAFRHFGGGSEVTDMSPSREGASNTHHENTIRWPAFPYFIFSKPVSGIWERRAEMVKPPFLLLVGGRALESFSHSLNLPFHRLPQHHHLNKPQSKEHISSCIKSAYLWTEAP